MKARLRLVGIGLLIFALVAGSAFYWNPLWFSDQQIRYHLWRSGIRSEYVNAGGLRIHYFEALPPDGAPGRPLLLVHGLGSRGEDWSPMMPALAAAGFHVYAPDLLGYGRSDKPSGPYTIAAEEQAVWQFVAATDLGRADASGQHKPFELAGWSMGGWIAAKFTLDHPDYIDRLVLYDSAGIAYQPSFARDAFVPTDAAGLERLMVLLMPAHHKLPDYVVRATLRKFARDGGIIQQSMDSMVSGSDLLDARLAGIQQPTLIVWGMEDRLIPPSVGETMHRAIPHSVFEGVQGCGHLAPSQCARPVLAGTIQFLQAQPAMQGGERLLARDVH